MKRIFTNLTFWVLLAITAGIIIGHYFPDIALYYLWDEKKTMFLGQGTQAGQHTQ